MNDSPPTSAVRFRVRALVWATTMAAMLAAIAGPYFRSQSSEGQRMLLGFWTSMAGVAAWSIWQTWRDAWKQPAGAGQIDFILWAAPKRWWGPHRVALMTLLTLVACLVWVSAFSKLLMERIHSASESWVATVCWIFLAGMGLGSCLRWMLPQPVRFCEAGVLRGSFAIPWRHVRSAEWAWSRPGVLRLHRLDGDIYAEAPLESRRDVEAYLRQRTTFIGITRPEANAANN